MPKISVFIQVFNLEQYIAECIQSVLDQKGDHNIEIIIVDDCSTDNSLFIVRKFLDPRIRVIVNATNKGCIETANIGYGAANGEYCARLDGDDRYRPGFLNSVIPILENNPNVGVVYGDIAMVDSAGRISSPLGCVSHQREGRPPIANELIPLLLKNYLPAPTTIGRTKIWQSLLPIPPSLHYLDYYMTTQAAHVCDFAFVNEVLADYRIHPGNQHSRMVLDKTGEFSTFEMLKMALNRPDYKYEKTKYKKQIEGVCFLDYANKYFGAGMDVDAKRCYWSAIKRDLFLLFNFGIVRRLLGTYLGYNLYNKVKRNINIFKKV